MAPLIHKKFAIPALTRPKTLESLVTDKEKGRERHLPAEDQSGEVPLHKNFRCGAFMVPSSATNPTCQLAHAGGGQ